MAGGGRHGPARFDGDLDDYQEWLRSRARAQSADGAQADRAPAASAVPVDPQSDCGKLRRELTRIEKRIASLSAEVARLDAHGADPAASATERCTRLRRDIASLESRWVEVGCALESAEAELSESLDG